MDSVHNLFSDKGLPYVHTLCMAKNGKTGKIDTHAKMCGERIKRARKEQGWTQEQLSAATEERVGKKARLGTTQIANFEQGTRRVGVEEAETLSAIFTKYPPAYFMGVVDERESSMLLIMRTEGNSVPKSG